VGQGQRQHPPLAAAAPAVGRGQHPPPAVAAPAAVAAVAVAAQVIVRRWDFGAQLDEGNVEVVVSLKYQSIKISDSF
jgi:hypothetical protein